MKRIIYSLICLMLTLAACTDQQESSIPPGNNMYKITVATESQKATRAEAPAQAGFTPRYILEIYNNEEVHERFVQTTPEFTFRLITGQNYDFLIWVDYTLDGISDYHYKTDGGLKNIALLGHYYNNDHSRDAFFGKLTTTVEGSSKDFGSIVCKRPFGQLNIKTTDWTNTNSANVENTAIKPTSIHMQFSAPTTFNVSDGSVAGNDTFEYDYTLAIANQNADVQDLTCDYIFAPASGAAQVSPTITFINANGGAITHTANYLANLPVQRNYQTNVSGQLISKAGKVSISIDAEWSSPGNDLTRPAELVSSFYIFPNDPNLNAGTGVYTINASQIDPRDNTIELIFDGIQQGAFPNNHITIIIPDNLPANIQTIAIEPSLTGGLLSFTINSATFGGTVILKNELLANKPIVTVGNLDIQLPNGSFLQGIGVNVQGDMSIWTKESTFVMAQGTVITGNLTINGGRAVLNGEVQGTIHVQGNSKVDIVKDGVTKSYWTSAITQKGVSRSYGFGVDVNNAFGLVLPEFQLPDFLNLSFSMNYGGAYAAFDFGNHTNGLNWNELRNVRYDFYAADGSSGSAKLKRDLNGNHPTPSELQDVLNKPINNFKEEVNRKVTEANALIEKCAGTLPPKLGLILLAEARKLQDATDNLNKQIPSIQLPTGPQVPLATIIPAADNFNFSSISQTIGRPGDKFNLLDIPGYINGSKPLTIYMIIDFLKGYQESSNSLNVLKTEKATLEAQKATLNAEKATINAQLGEIQNTPAYITLTNQLNALVADYNNLPKPANGPKNIIGIPSWVFVPATTVDILPNLQNNYFLNKWSVAYGSPTAGEITKMNNCNTKINAIEAQLDERNVYYTQQSGTLGKRLNEIETQIKTVDNKIYGTLENLFFDGLNTQIVAAETQSTLFQSALEQLGIPKDTVDSIIKAISIVEPYLATVADVANTVNNAFQTVQSYNPWEYPTKLSSKKAIVRMGVDATFEYASGKILHLYSK